MLNQSKSFVISLNLFIWAHLWNCIIYIMDHRDPQIQDISQTMLVDKSTPKQAFFNFLKTLIGIGAIALPYATHQVGWLWSLAITIPIVLIILKSQLLMLEVADYLDSDNLQYADIVKLTLGFFWPHIINSTTILFQLGICIAYLIFLTESLHYAFLIIDQEIPKWAIYLMTLSVIAPLSAINKIQFLHKTSQLGFYCAMGGFAIVFADCITHIQQGKFSFENKANYQNTFQFVGVALLACEGIVTSIPIRNSMREKRKFKSVAVASIIFAFFIAISVSLISVIAYQGELNPILLFSISSPVPQAIAIFTYSLSLILSYPLQLFPAIIVIEESLKQHHYQRIKLLDHSSKSNSLFSTESSSILIRTILIAVVYFVAFRIPHFSLFLNLIGSIFISALQVLMIKSQFLFPVLVHISVFRRKGFWEVLTYFVILAAAGVSLTLGTLSSLKAMK